MRSTLRQQISLLLMLAFASGACTQPDSPEPVPTSAPVPEGTPKLVLFLVIDQCRADYLERFRPLLTSGLDRLLSESVVFTNAHHDHAWTKTAPGHATLATGTHPSRHGIVSNEWYDRETGEVIDSDDDSRWDDDRSPYRMLAPTLSDRMKETWPESKVYGASGKSRGAILPAGQKADRAFWIDDEIGRFLTSTYYGETPPAWLAEFHESALPDRFFGTVWEPLPAVLGVTADLRIEPLNRGIGHHQFPHPVGRSSVHPDEFFYEDFYWTPFSDRYLLELAQTLLVEEELGADEYPDFLSLSFSALDLVGHAWGPDSPEVLDTLLRLDQTLGELFDFIDRRVGLENTLISFSADHGVSPVPEVSLERGYEARRFGMEERRCVQSLNSRLSDQFGEASWFEDDARFDRAVLEDQGVSLEEAAATAKRLLEECPGVERVWTATELQSESPPADDVERLHRNNFHPERSPDLLIQFEAWSVNRTDSTTTHGSPYPYDTHVPWLLRLPSGAHGQIDERVHTVDVAPTLAGILGVDLGTEIDGEDLGAKLP
jgi:predicted AlkP superfamily pyrophosphatase or phosphodiesterase